MPPCRSFFPLLCVREVFRRGEGRAFFSVSRSVRLVLPSAVFPLAFSRRFVRGPFWISVRARAGFLCRFRFRRSSSSPPRSSLARSGSHLFWVFFFFWPCSVSGGFGGPFRVCAWGFFRRDFPALKFGVVLIFRALAVVFERRTFGLLRCSVVLSVEFWQIGLRWTVT